MTKPASDSSFTTDVAQFYESALVPLIFRPYARDLAERAKALTPRSVLEIACGTGVVTRALAGALPAECSIVATDLNDAMVEHGQTVGTSRPVTWRQADVMALPFADASFDVVVCQFSVMFFPDRVAAYREVRRVLRPGGTFLFNVWNSIEAMSSRTSSPKRWARSTLMTRRSSWHAPHTATALRSRSQPR